MKNLFMAIALACISVAAFAQVTTPVVITLLGGQTKNVLSASTIGLTNSSTIAITNTGSVPLRFFMASNVTVSTSSVGFTIASGATSNVTPAQLGGTTVILSEHQLQKL